MLNCANVADGSDDAIRIMAIVQGFKKETNIETQVVVVNSILDSVINGSGPSHRVRVYVGNTLPQNWWSGLPIDPNSRFGYYSIDISQPI